MGEIYHASNNKCRAEVAILISEKKKTDFKTKTVNRDKK